MASPVISYPGAKWRFIPHMKPYFPKDMKVFIEPFFGGGSVSLSVADSPEFTKLERMVGGDFAPEIWAMWTGIKQNPHAVIEIANRWMDTYCPHQIAAHGSIKAAEVRKYTANADELLADEKLTANERIEIAEKMGLFEEAVAEGKRFWDWAKNVDCSQLTLEERAARTFLVNKISFSGMGDSGSLSNDQLIDFDKSYFEKIIAGSKLLQRIELYNVSFQETMKIGNDDPANSFIFLDPPYYKQESSGLYGRGGDTHKGFPHEVFAEFTKAMQCKWFMTYDDSIKVRQMFSGLTAIGQPCCIKPFTIPGGYTMAGKVSEDALAGEELFIANYDITDRTSKSIMDLL